MTKEYLSPIINAHFTNKDQHLGHLTQFWFDVKDRYRHTSTGNAVTAMRLLSKQYRLWRDRIHNVGSWDELMNVLNNQQRLIYGVPLLNVHYGQVIPFTRLELLSGAMCDVNTKFEHLGFDTAEDVIGPGWQVVLKIAVPVSHVNSVCVPLSHGLAAYGIYLKDFEFQRDSGDVYFIAQADLLERDWPNLKNQILPDSWSESKEVDIEDADSDDWPDYWDDEDERIAEAKNQLERDSWDV